MTIWISEAGFAERAPLDGPGFTIQAQLSRSADYPAARLAICAALLDASPGEAFALAQAGARTTRRARIHKRGAETASERAGRHHVS